MEPILVTSKDDHVPGVIWVRELIGQTNGRWCLNLIFACLVAGVVLTVYLKSNFKSSAFMVLRVAGIERISQDFHDLITESCYMKRSTLKRIVVFGSAKDVKVLFAVFDSLHVIIQQMDYPANNLSLWPNNRWFFRNGKSVIKIVPFRQRGICKFAIYNQDHFKGWGSSGIGQEGMNRVPIFSTSPSIVVPNPIYSLTKYKRALKGNKLPSSYFKLLIHYVPLLPINIDLGHDGGKNQGIQEIAGNKLNRIGNVSVESMTDAPEHPDREAQKDNAQSDPKQKPKPPFHIFTLLLCLAVTVLFLAYVPLVLLDLLERKGKL